LIILRLDIMLIATIGSAGEHAILTPLVCMRTRSRENRLPICGFPAAPFRFLHNHTSLYPHVQPTPATCFRWQHTGGRPAGSSLPTSGRDRRAKILASAAIARVNGDHPP
jgi:hypothetical protein